MDDKIIFLLCIIFLYHYENNDSGYNNFFLTWFLLFLLTIIFILLDLRFTEKRKNVKGISLQKLRIEMSDVKPILYLITIEDNGLPFYNYIPKIKDSIDLHH